MKSLAKPTVEQLVDWIDGRLDSSRAEAIETWVASDADLQQTVAWLQTFVGLRQQLVWATPPSTVRQALNSRFADYAARKQAAATQTEADAQQEPNLLRRLLAALTFDSAAQLGVAGARSAQLASARQLIYASELAEIVLNIGQPDAQGNVSILGQILPIPDVEPADFMVQLFKNGSAVQETQSDELGEFSFGSLQPDAYSVMLTYEQTAILLTPIAIQG